MLHSTKIFLRLLFPRAMSQVPCLHEHLANAARVKYPCALAHLALLRIKLDTSSACCGELDSRGQRVKLGKLVFKKYAMARKEDKGEYQDKGYKEAGSYDRVGRRGRSGEI